MSLQNEIKKIREGQLPLVTLVQGNETYLNEKVEEAFLKAVFPSGEIDEFSFGRFDMEDISLDVALEEASSMPFFSDYRLVFIENAFFLTSQKPKNDIEHDTDWLQEYVQDPSDSTRLVIFAPYESVDKRKKVTKAVLKHAHVISTERLDVQESRRYLQSYLSSVNFQMSPEAFEVFLDLTDNNLTKMMNELNKLFIYKQDDPYIQKQDVVDLVPRSLNQDVFSLNDAVLRKDVEEALEIYQDLLLQKESPVNLLALMLSQFRLFLQVKILRDKGYQQYDIQKILNVHKYRVHLAMKREGSFKKKDLMQIIKQLIEADYSIKTGQMDPKLRLELFIIQYCGS